MKRLLCGSLTAFLISMPLFAQTATSPDSSVGSGTTINQDAGATEQEAGSMDASRGTTMPADEQRMEETTPSTDTSTPGATQDTSLESTPTDDAEMQEESMDSEVEMQEDTSVPSTTTPSAMEESETQSE